MRSKQDVYESVALKGRSHNMVVLHYFLRAKVAPPDGGFLAKLCNCAIGWNNLTVVVYAVQRPERLLKTSQILRTRHGPIIPYWYSGSSAIHSQPTNACVDDHFGGAVF